MIYDHNGYPYFPQPKDIMVGFTKRPDNSVLVLYDFQLIMETLVISGLTPREAIMYFHVDNPHQCEADQGFYYGE